MQRQGVGLKVTGEGVMDKPECEFLGMAQRSRDFDTPSLTNFDGGAE